MPCALAVVATVKRVAILSSATLDVTSLQALRGQPTVFAPTAGGDWSRLFRLALAALICGFFWEMWNVHSQAKWIYAVPFVHRFQVFEMPILGFAGYLPFGIECAVIADLCAAPRRLTRSHASRETGRSRQARAGGPKPRALSN